MNENTIDFIPYIFAAFMAGIVLFTNRRTIKNVLGMGGVMEGKNLQERINNLLDAEKQKELFYRLRPVLNKAELYRRRQVKIFSLLGGIVTVTAIFYTIYAVPFLLSMEGDDNLNVVFIGYFVQGALPYIPIYLYKKHFKKHVTPLIAETIGYRYDEKGGATWHALDSKENKDSQKNLFSSKASLLFGSYNRVKNEDNFSGKYGEKDISFEEIKIIRGSGKHKKIIFKGLLMAVDAPKPAAVPVILKREGGGGLGRFFSGSVSGMEQVTLEDLHFEKEFDVYSTDQIKSRTVLTPRFMERLKGISAFYGGAPVMAAFYDEKVFIAVKLGQDLFEPASFFTDARSRRNIELILAQIELQHQVVDSLE